MTVFSNVLKRIFKNKFQAAAIIILPIAFILITALNVAPTVAISKVYILDNDNTEFTGILKEKLSHEASTIDIENDSIDTALINNKIDYAVVIDNGFTASLIKGEDVKFKGYSRKNSVRAIPIRQYLSDFTDSAKTIAKGLSSDENRFYEGINYFVNDGARMEYEKIADIDKDRSYSTLGLFVMFMLFTTMLYTTIILVDKENRTFFRTLTAPVTLKSYMVQCIFSFMVISIVQITGVLVFLKYILGIYMGGSFLSMYLLFTLASLVFVSLGVAISSTAKSILQACFVGIAITLPMSFLGGCWWRNEYKVGIIQTIGKFTPVYWVMEGVNKLLNNSELTNIIWEITFILLFAAILFLLGTWKKDEITA